MGEVPRQPIGKMRKDFTHIRRCPRCLSRDLPLGYPGALSRADNRSEVCSPCGEEEAFEDMQRGMLGSKADPYVDWPIDE